MKLQLKKIRSTHSFTLNLNRENENMMGFKPEFAPKPAAGARWASALHPRRRGLNPAAHLYILYWTFCTDRTTELESSLCSAWSTGHDVGARTERNHRTPSARQSSASFRFVLRGPRASEPHFIRVHPTVVETFKSGPKWWTSILVLRATDLSETGFVNSLEIKVRKQQKLFPNSASCFWLDRETTISLLGLQV